jgi:mono/diheme cytochrome c family protein
MFFYFLLPLLILAVPVVAPAQDRVEAKAGKTKYNLYCLGCHGAGGKGDGPAASSLNPRPRDMTKADYMSRLSDQYLFNVIKAGGSSVNKSPLMPAWGGTLSDKDIWNLVAYIRSLPR